MACLFGSKNPTLSLIYPCHFLIPLRIADSFRGVSGNVILGRYLTGALAVAAEALVVVLVEREVDEAFRA